MVGVLRQGVYWLPDATEDFPSRTGIPSYYLSSEYPPPTQRLVTLHTSFIQSRLQEGLGSIPTPLNAHPWNRVCYVPGMKLKSHQESWKEEHFVGEVVVTSCELGVIQRVPFEMRDIIVGAVMDYRVQKYSGMSSWPRQWKWSEFDLCRLHCPGQRTRSMTKQLIPWIPILFNNNSQKNTLFSSVTRVEARYVHWKKASQFRLDDVDHGTDRELGLLASQTRVSARPSVPWCYKKDLGFTNPSQETRKQN